MKKLLLVFLLLSVGVWGLPLSGLEIGEKATAHTPSHVTGPHAGSAICPICQYQSRPACQVFINGENDPVDKALLRMLSEAVTRQSKAEFVAFILFMKDEPPHLQALNQAVHADNVGLCLLKDLKIRLSPNTKSTPTPP